MRKKAETKSYRRPVIVGVVVVVVVVGILVLSRMQRESNEKAVAALVKRYAATYEAARAEGTLSAQEEAVYGELARLVKQPGTSVMGAVMAVAVLNDAGQAEEQRRNEDLAAAQELRDLLAENAAVGARPIAGIVQKHPYLREVLDRVKKSPGEYVDEGTKGT